MCSKPGYCWKNAQKDKRCSRLPGVAPKCKMLLQTPKVAEHKRDRPNDQRILIAKSHIFSSFWNVKIVFLCHSVTKADYLPLSTFIKTCVLRWKDFSLPLQMSHSTHVRFKFSTPGHGRQSNARGLSEGEGCWRVSLEGITAPLCRVWTSFPLK